MKIINNNGVVIILGDSLRHHRMDVLLCLVDQFLPTGYLELRHQECGRFLPGIRDHESVRLLLLLVVRDYSRY
jgi:hypothetical protein